MGNLIGKKVAALQLGMALQHGNRDKYIKKAKYV